MTKAKKFLSTVMAMVMLLGCLGMSSFALELPAELETSTVKLVSASKIASVEVAITADYTEVDNEAEFVVYYSAEEDTSKLLYEEVGKVTGENAYIKEGVLHVNLASLELTAEGYYYVSISTGALEYEKDDIDRYNVIATTEVFQYQFASLDIFGKISAFFGYIMSIITNMISNGAAY